MEQSPHPEHERHIHRRTTVGWLLCFPSLALLAFDLFAPWGKWVGVTGLLAVVVIFLSASAQVNRCRCPTCGRELRRSTDENPFTCEPCGVAWTTPCYRGKDWGA
jgi:hypothetical protein